MKSLSKASAFLLVGMMISSGLVALLSAPVSADYQGTDNIAINYDNNWQEPSSEPPTDVRLIWNWDNADNKPYWLGDQDTWIEATFINNDPDAADDIFDVEVTLTCPDGAIMHVIGDDAETDDDDNLGDLNNGGDSETGGWWFDVANNVNLGLHAINWHVAYEKPLGTDRDIDIPAYIYISSVFDNTATEDTHESLPDFDETTAAETTDFGRFEAGDQFVEGGLLLHNYATNTITNVAVTLDLGTTVEDYVEVVGEHYICTIPAGIASGAQTNAIWRLNIADGTPPDEYLCTATITYDRGGEAITEGVRNIYMEVDYSFRNQYPFPNDQAYSEKQCVASSVTITDTGEDATKQAESLNQEAVTDPVTVPTPTTPSLTEKLTNNIFNKCFGWLDKPAFSTLAGMYFLIKL